PRALAAAFRDVRVVIGCAGPFGACGEPVLAAALAAGAHYLDVAGEQAFLREMYERHDSEARRAGLCVVPGMGLEVAPGDLAAAEAASALEPSDDDPLDEVSVSYLLD